MSPELILPAQASCCPVAKSSSLAPSRSLARRRALPLCRLGAVQPIPALRACGHLEGPGRSRSHSLGKSLVFGGSMEKNAQLKA